MKRKSKVKLAAGSGLALTALVSAVSPGATTNLTWDSTGGSSRSSSNITDGSGTWSTSTARWWTGTNSTADVVWANSTAANPVNAIFGAGRNAAGTVTISSPGITVNNLTFNTTGSGNYTIAGSPLTLTGSITANVSATISAQITGSAGLTKNGAGTLTLSGSNNFTGGTIVSAGTLQLGNVNALAGGGLTTATGGTVNLNLFSPTITSLSGTGGTITDLNVSLGTTTLTVNQATNTTYSGLIEDGPQDGDGDDNTLTDPDDYFRSLALTKTGAGTLTLSGANTYTGGTIVNGGTLLATNSTGSATGAARAGISQSPGTVTVNSGAFLGGTGTIAGVVTVNTGGNIFAGLTNNTPGKVAGLFTIGGGSSLLGSSLLDLTAVNTSDEIVFGSLASPAAAKFGGILTITQPNAFSFASGQSYHIFDFSSETGTFTTLNLPTLTNNLVWNTSALYTNGIISIGGPSNSQWGLSTGGSWNIGSDWTNGSSPNAVTSVANFLSGPGLTAPGTITLDGNQTVGRIIFDNTNTYTITPGSGGVLTINDTGHSGGANPSITVNSGNHVINAPVSLVNGVNVSIVAGDSLSIGGNVTGSGGLITAGPGLLVLSGIDAYGNTSVTGGVLEIASPGSLGSANVSVSTGAILSVDSGASLSSSTALLDNGTVSLSNTAQTIATLNGTGKVTLNSNALTVSGGGTFPGVITSGSSNGNLTVTGGLLTLSGTNTYKGGTNLNGGVLNAGINANLGATTGALNFGGGTLQFRAAFDPSAGPRAIALKAGGGTFDTNGFSPAIAGTISGAGGLTKTGIGTLSLSGANTYGGGTTVNVGTLLANNTTGSATGTGNVTVAGGASLGGSGSINGAVTVNGTIFTGSSTPHATAVTLGIGNNSVFAGSTLLDLTAAPASSPGLGTTDKISIGGAITFGGTLTVANPNSISFLSGQSYDLFGFGSESGTFSTVNLPALSNSLVWVTSALYTNGIISIGGGGPANLTWNNSGGSGDGATWDVATNQNWNNGATSTVFNAGDNVTFNDVNNGHYAVTIVGGGIAPGSVLINTTSTYTFSGGGINGAAALTKSGGGILVLENANAYTGGTTISAGTLQLGDGATTNGSVAGDITDNAALVFANPNAQAFAGNISGSGSLGKSGSGTLTLSGSTSYGGDTNVNAGVLSVTSLPDTANVKVNAGTLNAVSYSPAAPLTVAGGATANISGVGLSLATVSNAGAVNFTASTGTTTLSGLTGAGTTAFTASGSLPAITGGTVTAGLELAVTGAGISAGSASSVTATATTLSGTGSLTTTGVAAIGTMSGGTANFSGPTSTITTLNGGSVIVTGTALTVNNGTYSGGISGTGSLTKGGLSSDVLTLSGPNTYGGNTTVSAGTLLVTNTTGSATSTGNVTVGSGASLGGTGIITGPVTISAGGTIFVGLSNNDPGKTAAVLHIGSGSSLIGSTLLDLTGANMADEIVVGPTGGGALTVGGALVVTDPNFIAFAAGQSYDLFGFGSESNSFATVTLPTLTGFLSWDTSALYTSGIISIGGGNPPVTSQWGISAGGSWSVATDWSNGIPDSQASQANFLTTPTGLSSAGTVTLDGDRTVGRITFDNTSSYTIAQGSGGTLTIDDTGAAGGAKPSITVTTGSHTISAPIDLPTTSSVTIDTANATSLSATGKITGVGGITKTGPGSLVLSAVDTFTGPTNVTGGSMEIASIASTSVSVSSDATLTIDLGASLTSTPDLIANGTINITSLLVNVNSLNGSGNIGLNSIGSNLNVSNGGVFSGNFTEGFFGFAGLTVTGGTLEIAAPASVGLDAIGTSPGATLTIDAGATLSDTASVSADGTINLNSPAQNINALNGAGKLTLNSTALTVNAGGAFNGTIADGTSPGSLVVASNLTLGGSSTYSGGTSVASGGILMATNSTGSATGTGAVIVNGGGGIGGTGKITGAVSILSGANIFAGLTNNTIGKTAATLTIGSGSSFGGSTLLDITGIDLADKIVIGATGTGSIAFGGNLVLTNPNSTAFAPGQSYDLFDFGSHTGTFAALTLPTLPGTLTWNTSALYTSGIISIGGTNASILSVGSNHLLLRSMVNGSQTGTVTLSNSSSIDAAAYSSNPTAGLTSTVSTGAVATNGSTLVAIGFTDYTSTGARSGSVGFSNTANASDPFNPTNVSLDAGSAVVDNRIVTASTVNLGVVHVNGTGSGTTNLSTSGDDNHFTRVTVAGSLFNSASSTGTASITSPTLVTATNSASGIVTLTTTGEGLNGETPIDVTVPFTAKVFSGNGTWNGASDSSWGTAGNWADENTVAAAPGTFAGFGTSDIATFGAVAAPTVVNLDGATPSVNTINFNGNGNYTIGKGSGGNLTLNNGAGTAAVNVTGGSHAITAPLIMASNVIVTSAAATGLTIGGSVSGTGTLTATGAGTLTVATTGSIGVPLTADGKVTFTALTTGTSVLVQTVPSLNITAGGVLTLADAGTTDVTRAHHTVLVTSSLTNAGTIDVSSNDLIIKGGNLVSLVAQLSKGYSGAGPWNGTGIRSSTAAADPTFLTTVGVIQNLNSAMTGVAYSTFDGVTGLTTGDVLVKYTYYGDANLDGEVDGTDYNQIDAGFASQSLAGWVNGDFNYDGKVDGSDYSLIDNAFNQQGSNGLAIPMNGMAANTSEIADSSSVVPEPANLTLIGFGAVGLIARRRRTCASWSAGRSTSSVQGKMNQ